jgi:leucyl/phenylalanyl-tRNA--protein transferase
MPIYLLNEDLVFPSPSEANEDGLLAIGGDLSVDRLLLAYETGLFPWYNPNDPILWWSPDPRCLLFIDDLKISKSMRNVLNQQRYTVSYDTAFEQVITACGSVPRKDAGTWITDDIKAAYIELHQLGIAHSVEVWEGEELAGGLYGVSLGSAFFGESMFSAKSNASKVGFIYFAQALTQWGFKWIDCQIMNPHLKSMGAKDVPRKEFLDLLQTALKNETRRGPWTNQLPKPH